MDSLIFTASPEIVIATNTFVNTPIIIRYKDTPMLEAVHELDAGYTVKIPIFHSDGTILAVAKATQLYLTEEGKKAGLQLRHPDRRTICCELTGKPLFEIRRDTAAALKMTAEVFTHDGTFLKWSDESVSGLLFNDPAKPLQIRGSVFEGCTFSGRVGIQIGTPEQPLPAALFLA